MSPEAARLLLEQRPEAAPLVRSRGVLTIKGKGEMEARGKSLLSGFCCHICVPVLSSALRRCVV